MDKSSRFLWLLVGVLDFRDFLRKFAGHLKLQFIINMPDRQPPAAVLTYINPT